MKLDSDPKPLCGPALIPSFKGQPNSRLIDDEIEDSEKTGQSTASTTPRVYRPLMSAVIAEQLEDAATPGATVAKDGNVTRSEDRWQPPLHWNPKDKRDLRARLRQEAFDRSLFDLTVITWHDRKRKIDTEDQEKWAMETIMIAMSSLPRTLIRALVDGLVVQAYIRNPEIRKFLDRNRVKATDQPCIYYQEFADGKGNPPSCSDVRSIVHYLQIYIKPEVELTEKEWAIIAKIDGQSSMDRPPKRYLSQSDSGIGPK